MNQTPRRAQEDKASIPFQSQYKNSMIHGDFLTLERKEKRRGEGTRRTKETKKGGRREHLGSLSWLSSFFF
jgi:hypothetical protein